MAARRTRRTSSADPGPADPTRVASDIAAFEASTGVAHGPMALITALLAAIVIGPVVGAVRGVVRRVRDVLP